MRSFDFYDTLAVRLVANPADIFSLVGERLNIPEFRSIRIAAEVNARSAMGGEVTYEQIYNHISLPLDLKERARLLELEFEHSLVAPVTAVISQLQDGDLVISDMYHDESLYRDVLHRLAPGVVPKAVLISGTTGVSKATGGLWKKVSSGYPTLQSHIGDNMFADIYQARRNGLVATHFEGAKLSRYEMAMAKQGGDGSIIAGVSRAVRLSLIREDTPPTEAASIEAFSSVFGPLFLAFAQWIMRTCDEEGIEDVYFLARDGQLPYRICSRLIAESRQSVRCHYIYASRQALHLPGCKTIEDAESWLLDNTPLLTLRILAERASVPLDVVVAAAAPHFAIGPEDNIPQRDRGLLSCVIRDPSFVAALMASVDRAFAPAATYYLRQGLAAQNSVALVDIGWHGRLQRSLGGLLEKAGHRPARILGLYLCLSRRLSEAPGDDLRGFVADPERPRQAFFYDGYRPVLEAALSADHPTTVGFGFANGDAHPLFGVRDSPDVQKKIALQHATIDAFVENVIAIGRAVGRPILCPAAIVAGNLIRFLSNPTRNDGLAFEGFLLHGGQTGTETRPITRTLRATDLLKRRNDLGFWREGTLSVSSLSAVAWVLRARRLMRGIGPPL